MSNLQKLIIVKIGYVFLHDMGKLKKELPHVLEKVLLYNHIFYLFNKPKINAFCT